MREARGETRQRRSFEGCRRSGPSRAGRILPALFHGASGALLLNQTEWFRTVPAPGQETDRSAVMLLEHNRRGNYVYRARHMRRRCSRRG